MIQLTIVTQKKSPTAKIAAIVLAAGGSTRMGEPKQLLPINGQPMVRRVVGAACAAGLDQVVVVLGAQAPAIEPALNGLPVDVVHNPSWAAGMSTSLQAGLTALQAEMEAVMVILADQPGLTPDLLQTLASRYRSTRAPIVVPLHKDRRGNPVVFARALFPELMTVEGDKGGRTLITRYQDQVEFVRVEDPAVLRDVDTYEDYTRAKAAGQR
jgi:molybdenum cofactor cytidylyltransferase